ncbi:MAG: diadenylate cyclase CdaA [Capsulimonadaceae bacterium]|nr:diadenylate cyclase CdaA [Capsulimonadaceae bacterium]
MNYPWHQIWAYFKTVPIGTWPQVTADILVVSYLIYHLMMLAKGTRAWQVVIGLVVFVVILNLSLVLKLVTLHWILNQMISLGPVAIVILFLPELRHALEEVGRLGFWGRGFVGLAREDVTDLVGEIVRAATLLSNRKTGALIVIEREAGLADIIETGTEMNANVTTELLGTIFYPGSPLHDGAVIIRGNRIAAAGCTLPLSVSPHIGTTIHTRHKAALGISEQSDAAVVVVSEETGIISLAFEGNLVRGLRDESLENRLTGILRGKERPSLRRRMFAAGGRVTSEPASQSAAQSKQTGSDAAAAN